ncbi:unnamed protein product [Closterium sp. NIES-53]
MDSRVSVINNLLVFCDSKYSDLENCARDLVAHENDGVRQVCLDAANLCAAYKLKLSTECVSIQAKLQALSELEAPGGEDLEEFCIIGSETLKELKRLIEDSDGVNRDAKKLHLKTYLSKDEQSKLKEDSQHDAKKKTKVVDARKKADAALTLAVAGAVVIPWFVFGATAAGVMAGYGGLMGLLVSKQFIDKVKLS